MFRLTSRLQRDLKELAEARFSCPQAASAIDGIEHGDPIKLQITIELAAGIYAGGRFSFKIDIPHTFPFSAPSVHCMSRVWHPNVCLRTGRVSLSILDEDWKPVISLNTIVFGLQLLFLEPNAELSLNNEATAALLKGTAVLSGQVQQTFRGGFFGGYPFSAQRGSLISKELGALPAVAASASAASPRGDEAAGPPHCAPRRGWRDARHPRSYGSVSRGGVEESKGGYMSLAESRRAKRKVLTPHVNMNPEVDSSIPSLQQMSIDDPGPNKARKRQRLSEPPVAAQSNNFLFSENVMR